MIRNSLVPLAFRQFASTIEFERALGEIATHRDFKAWFLQLPWDEKAFKINDDLASTDTPNGSAGNWLARICKDGPRLILTPTVHVFGKGVTVGGGQFWKQLILALHQTHSAFRLDRGHDRSGQFPTETGNDAAGIALHRWDKSHFHKWTRAPERPHQDDGKTTGVSQARQAYSLFYQ